MTNVAWANDYVGMKFIELGRTHEGVDCYGLVRLVYLEHLGIPLDMLNSHYTSTKDLVSVSQGLLKHVKEDKTWCNVLPGQQQPFDILVANISGLPVHCGIVLDKSRMLHIQRGCNAVIEGYRRGEWNSKGRIAGFYRHNQLCK